MLVEVDELSLHGIPIGGAKVTINAQFEEARHFGNDELTL